VGTRGSKKKKKSKKFGCFERWGIHLRHNCGGQFVWSTEVGSGEEDDNGTLPHTQRKPFYIY